ncbi:hypothetical protein [Kitasatospora acidiphila]|uniref:hypothetical protein n=1 Tax=Kitasatospora acidiphila TaxID=2567942 RepID=UPI003C7084C7
MLTFDPFGRGPGAVLRYGQGTAQGLLLAARLAERLGLLDAPGAAAHLRLLAAAGLPTELGRKAVAVRELVLLRALGNPRVAGGSMLTAVSPDDADALRPVEQPAVPVARAVRAAVLA